MGKSRFTVMPLLLAMLIGIANMPTNIFNICAWNIGTLEIEPWRRKSSAGSLRSRVSSLAARVRAFLGSAAGRQTSAVAAALIIALALASHPHAADGAQFAVAGAVGLKAIRQRDADLRRDLAQAKREKANIGEKAVAEKRSMNNEERAAFLAFTPTIEKMEADLADNQQLLRAAEDANEAERAYSGTQGDPDAAAAAAAAAAAGIRGGDDNATKAPGYFGRQLMAVKAAALAPRGGEPLTTEQLSLLKTMRASTGANTDVPSDGGFLVDSQRSSTILQRSYETGEILKRITPMPIGAGFNGTKVNAIDETSRADNSRFGGIVSGWLGQGNSLANLAGKPKFRQIDLKLRKVGALVYQTDELAEDAVAFESWVNQNLPKELGFRTEDAIINGTGAVMPVGIMQSGGALISVSRNTAGRVLSEDLRGMWKRIWAPLRSRAVWLIDQDVEEDIDQAMIAAGTGAILDPSYKPAGAVAGIPYATYKGAPIIPVEYCAALGTAGDVILANFDEYLLIDKGQVNQAVSLHVAFLTDEAVFRFTYRVDGQPTWNAPLTPKSGGLTKSPFVTLT